MKFRFLVVDDTSQSGINLNDDFEKIKNWVFQCKISLNPDINKIKKCKKLLFPGNLRSQIILL